MQSRPLPIVACGAALLMVGEIRAEQPNPLDTVPDNMPFDVPYGAPISLDKTDAAIAAAVLESKKHNWKLNVAIVDPGGCLMDFFGYPESSVEWLEILLASSA